MKLQAPVPVQAPLQPLNTMPASGVAVRLTAVPISSVAEQLLPQSMPLPLTLPVPVPALAALSVNCFLSKIAVDVRVSPFSVTAQASVPAQPPPLQPLNRLSAAGVAVSVAVRRRRA